MTDLFFNFHTTPSIFRVNDFIFFRNHFGWPIFCDVSYQKTLCR